MKQIPEELAERLHGEALTLCLCWRLTRKDSLQIGLTNHDQVLVVDDLTYSPGASLEAGRFVQAEGLKPGRAAAGGVLSNDAISISDLEDGLWDGCRVDVYRVDWQTPEFGKVQLWSGYLSEITFSETGSFEAELVSLKAELERPVGRVLKRRCDAVLGDQRCGIPANERTCDQRFETCRDVFANTENFRGFPHMPGSDFVLAGPAAGQNDGSKR